ncbi:hypothetical protein PV797_12405 [Clostridiaceae bacterium M8S5]|nr:hypothetical protein PV797_12405 [Clostridiaceae bacterium M8S5]
MNKIVSTLLITGIVATIVGSGVQAGAKGLSSNIKDNKHVTKKIMFNNGAIKMPDNLEQMPKIIDDNATEKLFIGKIISFTSEKNKKGEMVHIVKTDALFGLKGKIEIVVKANDLDNSKKIGFPKDYIISVFYNPKNVAKDKQGKVVRIEADVISAMEKNQKASLDMEDNIYIKDNQISKDNKEQMPIIIDDQEQMPEIIDDQEQMPEVIDDTGELFIGKIISFTTEKNEKDKLVSIVKTNSIFGLEGKIEIVINTDDLDGNKKIGFPKDYLISVFYNPENVEKDKKGNIVRIKADVVSAMEKDKEAKLY